MSSVLPNYSFSFPTMPLYGNVAQRVVFKGIDGAEAIINKSDIFYKCNNQVPLPLSQDALNGYILFLKNKGETIELLNLQMIRELVEYASGLSTKALLQDLTKPLISFFAKPGNETEFDESLIFDSDLFLEHFFKQRLGSDCFVNIKILLKNEDFQRIFNDKNNAVILRYFPCNCKWVNRIKFDPNFLDNLPEHCGMLYFAGFVFYMKAKALENSSNLAAIEKNVRAGEKCYKKASDLYTQDTENIPVLNALLTIRQAVLDDIKLQNRLGQWMDLAAQSTNLKTHNISPTDKMIMDMCGDILKRTQKRMDCSLQKTLLMQYLEQSPLLERTQPGDDQFSLFKQTLPGDDPKQGMKRPREIDLEAKELPSKKQKISEDGKSPKNEKNQTILDALEEAENLLSMDPQSEDVLSMLKDIASQSLEIRKHNSNDLENVYILARVAKGQAKYYEENDYTSTAQKYYVAAETFYCSITRASKQITSHFRMLNDLAQVLIKRAEYLEEFDEKAALDKYKKLEYFGRTIANLDNQNFSIFPNLVKSLIKTGNGNKVEELIVLMNQHIKLLENENDMTHVKKLLTECLDIQQQCSPLFIKPQ